MMNPSMNPTTSNMPFHALQQELLANPSALRVKITEAYRRDEAEAVAWLLENLQEIPAAKKQHS